MNSKNPDEIILKESFEPGLKHSLYSNFRKWTEAFLELMDNAVSNRIPKQILTVEVTNSKKHIRIVNKFGYGMTIADLQGFLEWGKIKQRTSYDIGAYSQGGKSAMGYLGQSMVVTASPLNEKVSYQIEDIDLHSYDKLKEYRVLRLPREDLVGKVEVRVDGLKRNIKDEELEALVADTYRPLIENGDVRISHNLQQIKIAPFPLDKDFPIQPFKFYVKRGNENYKTVEGWIGRLVPRSGLKGGLRCYKLGRLISDREFFGHPDANYKQTLNFLFGEIHLNHVIATTNKTGFDRDSDEWTEVQEKMFEILRPHIDDLLGREIQEPTDEEKDRIKKAKDIFEELLRLKKIDIKGQALTETFTEGQKIRDTGGKDIVCAPPGVPKRKNDPATPPPPNSTGKRKRLKEFMDWIVRPMDETVRSKIEENNGKQLLVINNLYSGYRASKGNLIYLLETAAIQLARPEKDEKMTPEEYIEKYDELFSFICSNIETAKGKLEERKKHKV